MGSSLLYHTNIEESDIKLRKEKSGEVYELSIIHYFVYNQTHEFKLFDISNRKNEWLVMCYTKDNFFYLGLIVKKEKVAYLLGIKTTELYNNLDKINKILHIRNDKLILDSQADSQFDQENFEKYATLIQTAFRGFIARERSKLLMRKKIRESVLITRKAILRKNKPYILSLFRNSNNSIFKISDQQDKINYEKELSKDIENYQEIFNLLSFKNGKPVISKRKLGYDEGFSQLSISSSQILEKNRVNNSQKRIKIRNDSKEKTSPKHQKHVILDQFPIQSSFQNLESKGRIENASMENSLDNKNASLSQCSNLLTNQSILKINSPYQQDTLQENRLMTKTLISDSKVFEIIVSLQSKFQEIYFLINIISDDSTSQISISIEKASENTGISHDWMIPLCNYLILKCLVIGEYNLTLDFENKKISLDALAVKIQK